MTHHHVAASARIDAAPKRVYDLLADYRHGHPQILPHHVSHLAIERGGIGAGTIVRFRMRIAGGTARLRAAVTEPEPGRVLAQTNLEGRVAVTTFTVTPEDGGTASTVMISTRLPVRRGLAGAVERIFATWALQPIHREELQRLAALMARGG